MCAIVLKLVSEGDYDSVATFKDADLNPHRAWRIVDGVPEVFIPGAVPWLPRQKLPKAYPVEWRGLCVPRQLLAQEAQSFWWESLARWLMPRDRSQDIDDSIDFTIVEAITDRNPTMNKSLQAVALLERQDRGRYRRRRLSGHRHVRNTRRIGRQSGHRQPRPGEMREESARKSNGQSGGAIKAVALELDLVKEGFRTGVFRAACMSTSTRSTFLSTMRGPAIRIPGSLSRMKTGITTST